MTELRVIAGGQTAGAKENRRAGSVWFNRFIVEYKKQADFVPNEISELTVEDVSEKLIKTFAAYLEDNCKTYNTARMMFSGAKNSLLDKFPSLTDLFTKIGSECLKDIQKHYTRKANETRTPIVQHHIGSRRK